MKYDIVISKLAYYGKWYKELSERERNSLIGNWIKERIEFFTKAANEFEKNIPTYHKPLGNYISNAVR